MTLHDRLKEIIEQYYNDWYEHSERGRHPDPTEPTITAIIAAFTERLPGEKEEHPAYWGYEDGWNAYRQEVLKVLSPLEIDTGDGFKPVSVDRGSFFEIDYKELLRKYMKHVIDLEDDSFVFTSNQKARIPFREQELQELERMARELGK